MKDIGKLLKDRRLSLHKTIDQASSDTKIPVDKIRAIEDGDFAYFNDDFSYLKFYVRHYCKYLGLDYEQYKNAFLDAISEFSNTKTMQVVEDNTKLHKEIVKKAEHINVTVKKEKRKIDYSMLSFIIVVILLIASIGYVAVVYGPSLFDKTPDPIPEIVLPTTTPETTEDVFVTPEETLAPIRIEQSTRSEYFVYDFAPDQDVTIDVQFAQDTWTRFSIDGVVSNNPASTVYAAGDKIQMIVTPVNDMRITIHLGYYAGNQIYINNELLVLDESVANLTSGQQIEIVFKGE